MEGIMLYNGGKEEYVWHSLYSLQMPLRILSSDLTMNGQEE